MAIELNHTIVPVRDKEESARFWEKIFGFEHQEPLGHFQPVHIASQSLSLDLDDRKEVEHHHYAFKVSEQEFDEIFGRIKEAGVEYGSGPRSFHRHGDEHLERRARRLLPGPQRPPAGAAHAGLRLTPGLRAEHALYRSGWRPSTSLRWRSAKPVLSRDEGLRMNGGKGLPHAPAGSGSGALSERMAM